MSGTLYVSAAGAEARMTQLDVISNNLANANTTGYRASEAIFEAELEAALLDQGDVPQNGRTWVGSTQAAIREGAGPVSFTGRDLDVAIQDDGFFVVETEAGPRYTRAGSFRVAPQGELVSISGHPVLGDGGPIQVGNRPLHIDAEGGIRNDLGEVVARLRIETFEDPGALLKEGASLLRAPEDVEALPVDDPKLVPKSLEGSNVQMVAELSRMVIVQRAFDAAMRTLQAEDTASSRLLQEI